MSVKVKMKVNWSGDIESRLQKGLLEMTTDVLTRAIILAPFKDGGLAGSGTVTPIKDGYQIKFGSQRVPYARRQNFEHKTRSHYLARAGEGAARGNVNRYFKGKV